MIGYLWEHREKSYFGSERFFRVWAKRMLTAPTLGHALIRHFLLTIRGAKIHPLASVGKATLDGHLSKLSLGEGTTLGRVVVMLHESVSIGRNVCINDGVQLLTGTHDLRSPNWELVKRPIVVEDHAWIATGAIILPGVRVGQGAVVGAGSVVSRDVPAYGLAVGNPALIRENRRTTELQYCPSSMLAFQEAWLGKNFNAA